MVGKRSSDFAHCRHFHDRLRRPFPRSAETIRRLPRPSGTWKWSVPGKDGATRELTLNLMQDGEKLTGSMVGKNGNTDITDGSVKDGQITFKLTRKRGDKEITSNFTGKAEW